MLLSIFRKKACKGRFCKNCLKNERFIHLVVFSWRGQMNKSLIFKVCSLSKWLQDRESVNFYRLPRESLLRTATYFILSLFWIKINTLKCPLEWVEKVISWREAHSSTGRLVTGWGGVGSAAQKTKLSITRSIFELEARNFAWK